MEEALVLPMICVQMLSNDNSVVDAPFHCVKRKLRGNGDDPYRTWCGCQYDVYGHVRVSGMCWVCLKGCEVRHLMVMIEGLTLLMIHVKMLSNDNSVDHAPFHCLK